MTRALASGLVAAALAVAATPAFAVATAGAGVPLEVFFRDAEFTGVTLSPDGRHIAVTVPRGEKTGVAILRVADRKVIGNWDHGNHKHVANVVWASNDRVIFSLIARTGSLGESYRIGLFTADLTGRRRREVARGHQYWVERRVRGEPDKVWITRRTRGDEIELLQLDASTTAVKSQATAPLMYGSFVIDHDNVVRYAIGEVDENSNTRTLALDGGEWAVLHEAEGGAHRIPQGFAPDNERVYFSISESGEPSRIVLLDPETGAETPVSGNRNVEPTHFIRSSDGREVLAIRYYDGLPGYHFIAPEHPESKLMQALLGAFPDHAVSFADISDDGNLALFTAYSDRDPGAYYLYNRATGEATFLLASRAWVDPESMAPSEPVSFVARDGQRLHGYLTVPNGMARKDLPVVVYVHGGPHGIRDYWHYDPEVQVLASRGYAVLRVNFRGSGGYGAGFELAGFRRWGTVMQDDLTDAVRSLIADGVADADRICIYGASYGGYAAMMSPIREPGLYRCAIGYAGIYSLPGMFSWGETKHSEFLNEILPEAHEERVAQSPVHHVDRLTLPVMLVHGRRDRRAPIQQYSELVDALEDAGRPPEVTHVEPVEGHGFYGVESNVRLYTHLFEFLDHHIGSP